MPSILDVRARERSTRRESRHLSQGVRSGASTWSGGDGWERLLARVLRGGLGRLGKERGGSVKVAAARGSWADLAGPLGRACASGPKGGERGRAGCYVGWAKQDTRARVGQKEGVASWAEGEKGERANLAPWAEMAFLFSSPFLISFLFLVPLYLLPRALGWYTCIAYHVFTQVGSTRVYYGSHNPMPRFGIDGH